MFGAPPSLEPILVGIESNVHWGYDLDFNPWPNGTLFPWVSTSREKPTPNRGFPYSFLVNQPANDGQKQHTHVVGLLFFAGCSGPKGPLSRHDSSLLAKLLPL